MADPAINREKYETYSWTQVQGGTTTTSTWSCRIRQETVSLTARNTAAIKARRQGLATWLPPLNYQRYNRRFEVDFGYYRNVDLDPRYSWQWSGRKPTNEPAPPFVYADSVALWNIAERKALQKLKNQDVNFAQFFVEAKQTADLLRDTAGPVAKALLKVKRGNVVGALKDLGWGSNNRQRRRRAKSAVRDAKAIASRLDPVVLGENATQATKTAASQWLAISFGWQPLLADLNGSAQLIAERSTEDTKRTRFSVNVNQKADVSGASTRFYQSNTWYNTMHAGSYGVRIRIDYMFDSTYLASLSRDGLTNPLALAWEEVPFSFLADYFVGIGDWLGNLDSSYGKKFVGGSATLWASYTTRYEERLYSYVPNSNTSYGYKGSKTSVKQMQRIVYGTFPDPTLIALQVKNPLDSKKHIGNSLALLVSAVGDFLKPR